MKRNSSLILLVIVLVLVQLACSLPGQNYPTGGLSATETFISNLGTATVTLPPIITATSLPNQGSNPTNTPVPTKQPAPTATKNSGGTTGGTTGGTSGGDGACTFKVTYVNDVTIPDDTVIAAGSTFVKTWLVRNDGTCTWGPNGYALHALAFTGGSQMGAPGVIPLHANVQPGQTIDVSVTLTAPSAPGTYYSDWMFRVDNAPNGVGPNVGVGSGGDQPLYARIKVNSSLSRLNFASGATAINVNSSLAANQTKGYVLSAMKDQVIMAIVSSAVDSVKVKITASDNTALGSSSNQNGMSAMAPLPSTQDYIVWVSTGSQAADFALAITIPSRITFDPGATSASVDGKVSSHMQVSYILRALAGQTMTVDLSGSNVGLTIYGLKDGQPLVRAEGGATSWTGKLPATQDYILIAVPAVDSTTFTLDVTVK
jgi:hypothetical protein